ncbi:hypothetical protein EVAR_96191_1 [Eumeta japonica]|uniref:Uncharacterized protein n=1 Tax=Eumeta variegata TaxID=151549 RepID=A0A4C1VJ25_EUMVA|nr:hypothetical protein EVAR_96191_1 [Eumeta japonica]
MLTSARPRVNQDEQAAKLRSILQSSVEMGRSASELFIEGYTGARVRLYQQRHRIKHLVLLQIELLSLAVVLPAPRSELHAQRHPSARGGDTGRWTMLTELFQLDAVVVEKNTNIETVFLAVSSDGNVPLQQPAADIGVHYWAVEPENLKSFQRPAPQGPARSPIAPNQTVVKLVYHENEPVRKVRCHILTDYRRRVAALAVVFRPRLMMELEGGHRNSVVKRRNPIEFGLV